jgi:hypothetical protein
MQAISHHVGVLPDTPRTEVQNPAGASSGGVLLTRIMVPEPVNLRDWNRHRMSEAEHLTVSIHLRVSPLEPS